MTTIRCTFLFHGAGSANVGAAALLMNEAGVPKSQIVMTNSRGIIWVRSLAHGHAHGVVFPS